jgi:hypothetical protein
MLNVAIFMALVAAIVLFWVLSTQPSRLLHETLDGVGK